MSSAIVTPPRSDPREPGLGTFAAVLAASLAVHLTLYFAISAAPPLKPKVNRAVDMEIVEREKPKPPPVAKPAPEPPKPIEKPKPVRVKLPPPVKPPPPVPTAPPPPTAQPEKPPPPAPMRIGLHLDSTTRAGSFAAPVGNTLYGKPEEKAPPPDAKPYAAPATKLVPSYQLTDAPVPLNGEVIGHEYYPPQAQKDGLEGQVTLKLTLDETGKVTAAQVLKGSGHGFDEAAVRGAREKLRFRPARLNGQPVPTEITYKITFLLD